MSDEKSRLEEELIAVNRGLRVLSAVNEALVRTTSEDELIEHACRIAVEAGGYRMAWVGLTDGEGAMRVRPACHAGYDGGYLEELCASLEEGKIFCDIAGALQTGRESIRREITAGPEFERGYRSSISLPVRADGLTLGAFNLFSDMPEAFQQEEVALLRQMTSDLGYGIMALRVRAQRDRAEQALEKERAQFTIAIDLLPFPIYFVDADQNFSLKNRAAHELMANLKPFITNVYDDIQLLDPQTLSPIPFEDWPSRRALRGETVINFEAVLRLPTGREFPVLAQAAPIMLEGQNMAVVAFQDITPLKEVDRAKNQFLSVLSHELRTPLSAIIGWAGMAQSNSDIVPEALEVVLRNADRMRLLVERLLILTRISTERLGAHQRDDDLWKIAQEAARGLKERAERQQATLAMQPPPETLRVKVDPENIRQALREVMDNAVKFSRLGGGIEVTGELEDGTARITIHDNGRGIPPDQLAGLLTPFQQLTRDERLGGLGIGLALARGLVEANGGRLEITSPGIGKGTTVRLSFPVVE